MISSKERTKLINESKEIACDIVNNMSSNLFDFLNSIRIIHVEKMAINKIPSKQRKQLSVWCKELFEATPSGFKRDPEDYPINEGGVHRVVLSPEVVGLTLSGPFENAKPRIFADDRVVLLSTIIQRSILFITSDELGPPNDKQEFIQLFNDKIQPMFSRYMDSLSEILVDVAVESMDNKLKGGLFKLIDMLRINGFLSGHGDKINEFRKDECSTHTIYLWLWLTLTELNASENETKALSVIWDIPLLIKTLEDIKDGNIDPNRIDVHPFIRLRVQPTHTQPATKCKPILMFYDSDKNVGLKDNGEVMGWVKNLLRVILPHCSLGIPLNWKINVMDHHPNKPLYTQPSYLNHQPTGGYPHRAQYTEAVESLKLQLREWCDSFDITNMPQQHNHQFQTHPRQHGMPPQFPPNQPRLAQENPIIDIFVIDVSKAVKDNESNCYLVNQSLLPDTVGAPPKITYRVKELGSVRANPNCEGDPDFGMFRTGDIFLEENGSF